MHNAMLFELFNKLLMKDSVLKEVRDMLENSIGDWGDSGMID